jgi:hypothetical protein
MCASVQSEKSQLSELWGGAHRKQRTSPESAAGESSNEFADWQPSKLLLAPLFVNFIGCAHPASACIVLRFLCPLLLACAYPCVFEFCSLLLRRTALACAAGPRQTVFDWCVRERSRRDSKLDLALPPVGE